MNRQELEQAVIAWAKERNLNDPVKQTLKTLSEAGELADAVCKASNNDLYVKNNGDKREDIIDAIGDIEVCLTILKHQLNLDQETSLELAYEEIKNRTGETVNGTFVKD